MYVKSHSNLKNQETYKLSLPSHPHGNTCVFCGKVCKSSPGLKRHEKS